jgi:hypothetical protein
MLLSLRVENAPAKGCGKSAKIGANIAKTVINVVLRSNETTAGNAA